MKLCIQTGGIIEAFGFEKGLEAIKNAGFDSIDWGFGHALNQSNFYHDTYRGSCIFEKGLDEVVACYEERISLIRKYGLEIYQAHAPTPSYIHSKPEVLDYNIEIYKRMVEFMDYLGCENLVIHGVNFLPFQNREMTPEMHEKLNFKLYESLIPALVKCKNPVKVCLENIFNYYFRNEEKDFGFEEGVCCEPHNTARWIDTLNAKAGKKVFAFCFDTGHANLVGYKQSDIISVLGDRISCLHVHDNDGREDFHLSPFTGTVDWVDFCDALKSISYNGAISFETFAQIGRANALGTDMCSVWLETLCKMGKLFDKKITE